MKIDGQIVALATMLVAALMATLLPLTGNFGRPTPVQTTIFVLCAVLSAFVLGKRFGKRAR